MFANCKSSQKSRTVLELDLAGRAQEELDVVVGTAKTNKEMGTKKILNKVKTSDLSLTISLRPLRPR